MTDYITIGSIVALDLQTRLLTRTCDGESVTLPASACVCLSALVEAQGEILSQEQLMDIGWRSSGIEVTENSVRVMVNKIRRAFITLEVQDQIALVAVTRSGYRLVLREERSIPAVTQSSQQLDSLIPEISPPAALTPKPLRFTGRWWKFCAILLCGVLLGVVIGLYMRSFYYPTPLQVSFEQWNKPGVPADTIVMVQKEKRQRDEIIQATLNNFKKYVLDKRPNEKPAKVLYITTGPSRMDKYQGLIACQKPLQDSKNDCESFYFYFH
ncbi:transcriptional regulator [Citrobacter sp. wls619]|uniref:winged helix-turn-helix domain-containing protein n=1 Tax=Citrobacter sp. wls619 TaxID=2576432 RepID=UPI0010C96F07|nr:winged helix-turn-helix domain-containing protein [Citrobacter sp. wls619]TKV07863.1 transcriptional regulator [Citrobacter sp. wls619]